MSTTIFQAPQYDPARERRRRNRVLTVLVVVLVLAAIAWHFRYWSYEHRVGNFFSDLQNKNYEAAYGLWVADPNWKQHADKYKQYPFNEFQRDWGQYGEWGVIRNYKVECAAAPPGSASGVVVVVTVNERVDPKAQIWVEKKDKSLTFSPFPANCHPI